MALQWSGIAVGAFAALVIVGGLLQVAAIVLRFVVGVAVLAAVLAGIYQWVATSVSWLPAIAF